MVFIQLSEKKIRNLTGYNKIIISCLLRTPMNVYLEALVIKWLPLSEMEFKSWTRLFAFHIHSGKVSIQQFSLQLWINSRVVTSLGVGKFYIQTC